MTEIFWRGEAYALQPSRILILGESWYGPVEPIHSYICRWINRTTQDRAFSRIFNAASGHNTYSAGLAERRLFWAHISFYNFVPGSIGQTILSRPTINQYLEGARALPMILNKLRPHAIWVLGKEQSKYSEPVIEKYCVESHNCIYEISLHPTSRGVRNSTLQESWLHLKSRLPNAHSPASRNSRQQDLPAALAAVP